MVVGLLKVSLILPGNASLKGKRKVVKSLIGRLKSRFNVSAAEVENNDMLQRADIGLAFVGNDHRFVNSVLDKLVDFIEFDAEAEVAETLMEIESVFP